MNLKRYTQHICRWRSGDRGPVLEISLRYLRGGMNYSTYKIDPRGYYVSFQPMTVDHGDGLETEQFMCFSGSKAFVKVATRFSEREFRRLAERLDVRLPQLAERFKAGDNPACLALVAEIGQ